MLLEGTTVDLLRGLFEKCAEVEELPHSFDDTLVDKLIDHISFTDRLVAQFLLNSLRTLALEEQSSVCVSLYIRLMEKYVKTNACIDAAVVQTFLASSERLLEQDRSPRVFSDLLHLYATCFHARTDWSVVLTWALEILPDESLSVFIRRKLEDFICLFTTDTARSFLHNIVDLFNANDLVTIRNGLSTILLHFFEILSDTQRHSLLSSIQQSTGVGQAVYELAGRIARFSQLDDELKSSKWSSQNSRTEVLMTIIQSNSSHPQFSQLVDHVLLSPAVKLRHFVQLLNALSDEQVKEHLPSAVALLRNRRTAPLSDVKSFLSGLCSRYPVAQVVSVMEALEERLLESPCLLEQLCNAYGQTCLDVPPMHNIKRNLFAALTKAIAADTWETRDTALEIATSFPALSEALGDVTPLVRSDPSPYVRSSALRLLLKQKKADVDLCQTVILSDHDPEPRLIAIRHLSASLPHSLSAGYHILEKAIEDTDYDVRQEMLTICEYLMRSPEYAERTRHELLDWKEDAEIGVRVRRLLGEAEIAPVDPTLRILSDMISALKIDIDDTIDCY